MSDDGGLSRIQQRMAMIPLRVREAVQPALKRSGDEMAAVMKLYASSSKDSGALIDSIEVTEAGQSTPPYSQPGGSTVVPENSVAVTAGNADVRYPHLVEYGTAKAPAQPFFWPAVRTVGKRERNRIKRAIAKAVRDTWGKR